MNFSTKLSRVMNAGQSRSVFLTGNIYDLFWDGEKYVPLINYLCKRYELAPTKTSKGVTQVIYEVNSNIEIRGDVSELVSAWETYSTQGDMTLDEQCQRAKGNPTFALELLRLIAEVARKARGRLKNNLLIIVEGADILLPDESLSRMQVADRRRMCIVHDWLSDPEFMEGSDNLILISESRSLIHHRVSRLPQSIEVSIPSPSRDDRQDFIDRYPDKPEKMPEKLADLTASLSLHALRQLLCEEEINRSDVIEKVESFITSQLGEGTVEFKKPSHKLSDVRGFSAIKPFIENELIPRFLGGADKALPGAAFGGPIGGGKTFLGEAIASEIGIPVLVLKNLRSKWFGETDVIFERLKRALTALDKVIIFVDEADTQFGNVSSEGHATERRLTGGIQAMMSDPRLRGKVMWLLMTARIHLLSPDIRRPGRVGDLIIPILDPEGEDKKDFIDWVFGELEVNQSDDPEALNLGSQIIESITDGYSAAAFASLRSQIKASDCKTLQEAVDLAQDMISPDIQATRKYQSLQAMMNCTRLSLLPENYRDREKLDEHRASWSREIRELELKGIN